MLIERYKEQIQNFYNQLRPLGLEYEITFIEYKGKSLLTPGIIPELENEKICVYNNKKYSLIDFYQKYGDKEFKMCVCYVNDYTLDFDGILRHVCTGKLYQIEELKDIKFQKILCPFKKCSDMCHADLKKDIVWKTQSG